MTPPYFWKVLEELALLLLSFTALLILVGSCIRLTHSGLSCPDWPLCYGLWLPTYSKIHCLPHLDYTFSQVLFEWSHRFLAGTLLGGLFLFTLAFCFYHFIRFRFLSLPILSFLLLLALLILVQIVLGSFTVFAQNESWTVALHLFAALLFFFFLWGLRIYAKPVTPSVSGLQGWAFLTVVLCLFTMTSGAMMAKSGASLIWSTWPWWDSWENDPLYFLHASHRLGSTVLLLSLAVLAWKSRGTPYAPSARGSFFLCLSQALYGGLLIFFAAPFGASLGHVILSLGLISMVSSLFWRLRRASKPN